MPFDMLSQLSTDDLFALSKQFEQTPVKNEIEPKKKSWGEKLFTNTPATKIYDMIKEIPTDELVKMVGEKTEQTVTDPFKALTGDEQAQERVLKNVESAATNPMIGDVKIIGHHGGEPGIKKLALQDEVPVYFSPDRFAGELYAGLHKGDVYSKSLELQSPQYRPSVMKDGKRSSQYIQAEESNELKKQGYDSVIGIDPETGNVVEIAVLDEKAIRSLPFASQHKYRDWLHKIKRIVKR